jgi:lipopolysaccharide/colanic/teichoic acid biosynthesis glycosyltransferase/GT2 family glycosyltransferase
MAAPAPDNSATVGVAIIIPCRDEEAYIEPCLKSILANAYSADCLEILIMDGGSQDGTRAIVEAFATRHPHIRLIDNPAKTIPAAMNLGIMHSSASVVMKLDAHSTYPPDYISACVHHLLAYPAEMTGGVCSIAPRVQTPMAEAIAAALSHRFASGNAYVKIGASQPRWADAAAFGCWRRKTLEELGYFDERMVGSSDMDLNRRLRKAGGKILLLPHIKTTYFADPDLKSFWRHNVSDGVWTTYALRFGKHASSWRHWIPLALVLALLAGGYATLLDLRFGWVLGAIGGLYLLSNFAASILVVATTKNSKHLLRLPVVFAVRHLAHGFGALFGLILVVLPGSSWRGRRAGTHIPGYTGQRVFDLFGAIIGLLVCAPFLCFVAILIKLDSVGPILYRGERLGRLGRPFYMLKFRTMNVDSGPQAVITPEDDSRITRVGLFLRKYKLDELPQLINVLRGEMSLVGPRPECAFYFQFYHPEEERIIHSVKPGMTDYGSLRFHDEGRLLMGLRDPLTYYVEQILREKVGEQLRYVREQSFCTDLRIVYRTLVTLFATRMKRVRSLFPTG